MKRVHKILLSIAGGLLLIVLCVLFFSSVPSANALPQYFTFSPVGVAELSPTEQLCIQACPAWSQIFGDTVPYRFTREDPDYALIVQANINRPGIYSGCFSAAQTPSGEYRHSGEYPPFNFNPAFLTVCRD